MGLATDQDARDDRLELKLRAAPGSIALDPDATTADAFRVVGRALLGEIASQAQRVRDHNPDGVHRMRINLRRLRAAITIFADLVAGEQTDRLKQELRWLTGRLGPARDLHVMDAALKAGRGGDGDPPYPARLLARLSRTRATAFKNAANAVSSPRFRRLLRAIQQWIEAGDWSSRPALPPEQRDARRFAQAVLAGRAGRVMRRAKKLGKLDVPQRHRLRIAMKKLYYAIGFFDSLFDSGRERKRLRAFRKRLKRLLDDLGALNDVAVQREMLAKLGGGLSHRPNGHAPLAPPRRIKRLLSASAGDGRKLADARPFWH